MRGRGASGINMLLGIDKPVGCSSHDVVNQVRRALGERRVGHAGTLDPLASGVLVVGVGQATRLLDLARAEDKRYLARFAFGSETATDDAEGAVTREAPAPERALDEAFARASMGLLTSMTSQVPPQYSAISVDGRRAYDVARHGGEVRLDPREVRVLSADLVAVSTGDDGAAFWDVIVDVSKGTYVRAMARDLGRALGSACHLAALRRLSSGPVGVGACVAPDDLAGLAAAGELPALDPLAVVGARCVRLTEGELADVRTGRPVRRAGVPAGEQTFGLARATRLYAIARAEKPGILQPKTVFVDGVEGVSTGEEA